MSKDKWLKLHTSILTSSKFCSLPDNDHRWLFICLTIFCKKQLINESTGLIPNGLPILLANAGMNHRKFKRVSKRLSEVGLIQDNLFVTGFHDSQLTPAALRMRKMRGSKCDETVTPNVTTESRKQKVDEESTEGNKSPTSPKTVKEFPLQAVSLARLLAQKMVDNDPRARLPKTEKQKNNWLDAIDKINRIDGRSWDEIQAVINWSQEDDFWKQNILSGQKLRKQFPKLRLGMQNGKGGVEERNRTSLDEYLNGLEETG